MDPSQYFNVENLTGQQIPSEIVEQLRVLGRVQFPLKETTASAVSTSAQEPDDAQNDSATRLQDMLDHVAEMEALVEQLEDMIDQLTKDMNIPVSPANPSLLDAVQTLGGTDAITRDVLDRALAIIDNGPIMLMGQDPIGSMLGNGKLEGDYLNCDEITRGVAKVWNTADPKSLNPEDPIVDATTEIAEDFEKNKDNQILEMLLMLWWNMMWPKFIVTLVIVNPIRTIVAYPMDAIVMFFKNMQRQCNKGAFKTKPKECLKNYGPLNKALNKLACFLLCKIPPKLYRRYKPMVDPSEFKILKDGRLIPCDCNRLANCPPENRSEPSGFNSGGGISELGKLMENLNEPCAKVEDFIEGVNDAQPQGLGMPPGCLKAAQVVLSAVISDALTPSNPAKSGITGSASITSILQAQSNQFGT